MSKAENISEKETLDGFGNSCSNKTCVNRIRNKAIEEFAERLIATFCYEPPIPSKINIGNIYTGESIKEIIDEIAESMKGGK